MRRIEKVLLVLTAIVLAGVVAEMMLYKPVPVAAVHHFTRAESTPVPTDNKIACDLGNMSPLMASAVSGGHLAQSDYDSYVTWMTKYNCSPIQPIGYFSGGNATPPNYDETMGAMDAHN